MTVAAILKAKGDEIISVPGDTLVRAAVSLLASKRIGALPVIGATGEVEGIFSERDVLTGLASDGELLLDRPVSEVMTSPAISVAPDLSILAALALMTRRRIRHLPVVKDGTMIGFVSIGDLVKLRIDRIEAEAEAMRSYIAGH